jgi:acetyltransferase-like isoleucine patch superfamily enzyme
LAGEFQNLNLPFTKHSSYASESELELSKIMAASTRTGWPVEDPLRLIPRILRKLYSFWLKWTYPFGSCGPGLSVHYTCRISRCTAPSIRLGKSVCVSKDTWLNAINLIKGEDRLILEDNVLIGARCQLSAKNCIHVERNVIIANGALIMDHNHAYEETTIPIVEQGVTEGGRVRIGEGTWIGHGAVILCDKSELTIGRNCVIGANAVLSRSVPSYSVVLGNPGRVVRQFDPVRQTWTVGSVRSVAESVDKETAVVS